MNIQDRILAFLRGAESVCFPMDPLFFGKIVLKTKMIYFFLNNFSHALQWAIEMVKLCVSPYASRSYFYIGNQRNQT